MDVIQELNETGGHTVFLVTHEIDTGEHAQRMLYMLDGG